MDVPTSWAMLSTVNGTAALKRSARIQAVRKLSASRMKMPSLCFSRVKICVMRMPVMLSWV